MPLKRSALFFLFASTIALNAHDYTSGTLQIDHPMAFQTPPSAQAGGGYLTITNNGPEPDRLIEVQADFPRVMLHTTEETDSVSRMKHLDSIEIPAGETVSMAPGGLHVMFMGLNGDAFEEGEKIPATLIFEKAGAVEITFNVEARTGEAVDHSNHNHSN